MIGLTIYLENGKVTNSSGSWPGFLMSFGMLAIFRHCWS